MVVGGAGGIGGGGGGGWGGVGHCACYKVFFTILCSRHQPVSKRVQCLLRVLIRVLGQKVLQRALNGREDCSLFEVQG